jgi:FMN reductase
MTAADACFVAARICKRDFVRSRQRARCLSWRHAFEEHAPMNLVIVSGSPTAASRSAWLAQLARTELAGRTAQTFTIAVRELPADALVSADTQDPDIARAIERVVAAELLLVATPIYKAAYSGLLKVFLDLLPQDALRGKTVLPIATGGSNAHLLALDYALKPVLSALGARDILDSIFASDAQLARHGAGEYVADAELLARLRRALAPLGDRPPTHAIAAMPTEARCSP